MPQSNLLIIIVTPIEGDEETADRVLTNLELASRTAGNENVRRGRAAEATPGAKSGWVETLTLLIDLSPYAGIGVEVAKIIGLSMRRRHISRTTVQVGNTTLDFEGPLTPDQQALIERLVKEGEGEESDGESGA
ncbi:hypothetical protein FKO01_32725 [Mesorhizobium sp. B2-3-3]|uniref:hypothetical protein n=1 Tax=Streptomyces sp. NPDC088922 TaxID=3156671 RepID=UPI001175AC22|nr:hypothetical protein FKO01_32725 [Mesorhizobium sp. B2-3-3]